MLQNFLQAQGWIYTGISHNNHEISSYRWYQDSLLLFLLSRKQVEIKIPWNSKCEIFPRGKCRVCRKEIQSHFESPQYMYFCRAIRVERSRLNVQIDIGLKAWSKACYKSKTPCTTASRISDFYPGGIIRISGDGLEQGMAGRTGVMLSVEDQ